MDAQTWQLISIIGYSLAGLLFIIAITMFFKMSIWSIIGDLTGRTAAKQIQEIRERNSKAGNKRYQPSAFNLERGKLTEPVGSHKLSRKGKNEGGSTKSLWQRVKRGQTEETARPEITQNLPTGLLPKVENHVPENSSNRSPVFKDTTVLTGERLPISNDTVVLKEAASGVEETTVLNRFVEVNNVSHDKGGSMEATEMPDHSTEVLEQGTEVLANETEILGNETVVLTNSTAVLSDGTEVLTNETEVLANSTEVLSNQGTEEGLSQDFVTTVLNPTEDLSDEEHVSQAVDFKVVKDIKIIHTDKVI
ncbi:hypothetical protein R4Z10_18910 [Niallia sp. XMNu-256]|uniref:hypothetical protein n=1 Tax=Niallia sp. XMNu-256 TaxID=3082444 RepID=UPI0030D08FD7